MTITETRTATAYEQRVPRALGDLIRLNCDQLSIYLTPQSQIAALTRKIPDEVYCGLVFFDWRFITFHDHSDATALPEVRLLGESRNYEDTWLTNRVTAIDLARGMVRIGSSLDILHLPSRGHGEPPQYQLTELCVILHQRGLGLQYGVPNLCRP
jgi:hypothetical protein